MESSEAMSFSLLPEAKYYPHPKLSWLIAMGFHLTVGALYRIEHALRPGCRPGTLVVSNHQRESDVPIVCAALCRRRGLHFLDPLPFFAMREDLLDRHALTNLLWRWPRPLRRALGLIPLGWMFQGVRTMPMRRLREFMLGEAVEALVAAGLGEETPEAVLNARGQREVIGRMQKLPPHVRDITRDALGGTWRTYWGLRRLRLSALRRIEPDFRTTINTQLDSFAALLDGGHSLYMAPEGTVSLTGRFGRVRAGPWRVSTRRASPALIMPVCVLTPSHLLAWYLRHGPQRFTSAQLATWLERGRDAAHAAGVGLDPIWKRSSGMLIAQERVRWMRRKRLLEHQGGETWRNIWLRDSAPGWDTPAGVVAYFNNSLTDFAPDFAQALEV